MGWNPALIVSFISSDGVPYTIAGPGDVNGDGYDDIVLGAPYWDDGLAWPDTGRAFVFAGGPDGPSSTPSWIFDGENAEEFGSSVDIVGDTNGDGYDEMIVGAPGPFAGEAYLYAGSAQGPVYSLTIYGSQFGGLASSAGDVNGDGFADLAVANPYTDGGFDFDVGSVQVYAGSASGLSTTPIASFYGEDSDENLGITKTAADVDGDGFSDLILGRMHFFVGEGGLDVHHGSATGLAGTETTDNVYADVLDGCDVNGDGYDDILALDSYRIYLFSGGPGPFPTAPVLLWEQGSSSSGSLDRKLSCAGDYNDDGYEDLLSSDPSDGGGRVDLFAGGPSGPNFDVPIHLYGGSSFGNFGYAVRGVGDVNGDGYDDFAVLNTYAYEMAVFLGHPDVDGDGVTTSEDCDDDDPTVPVPLYEDLDGDGFGGQVLAMGCPATDSVLIGGDCDDASSSVFPGAAELPGDAIDADCDERDLCYTDADGDGFRSDQTMEADVACAEYGAALASLPAGDCDDGAFSVNPGAEETPADALDANCDGVDLCYVDADEDGFRTDALVEAAAGCTEPGTALASLPAGDCDDSDPDTWPDADEIAGDERDQDCNGRERCYVDEDEDGFRSEETVRSDDIDCDDPGEATLEADVDCDDDEEEIYPDATDIPGDGIDQDCDGEDASTDPSGEDPDKKGEASSGCGCDAGGSPLASSSVWALLGALLLGRRRRGR